MTGIDKLPMLRTSKSANHDALKGVKSLPTKYIPNKTAWMTGLLFIEWVKAHDKKFHRQNGKVVFIIDNCPVHPRIQGLKAIKLIFLSPSTTKCTQPRDQGIATKLKVHYHHNLIQKFIKCVGKKQASTVNILDALHFLHKPGIPSHQQPLPIVFTKLVLCHY
nr:PREDICTED: tigger transposable element-derived protein 4-like [Latimeria chalumnae]|eukprot:XP_014342757.1 PREDICTED: tigger transposable element-derived protein 4-like [Latimeria chalumnae]